MTPMRSLIEISSGMSEDTMTMLLPAFASSTMMRKISARAPDVHALGRLIEDVNQAIAQEPAADDSLLLVAAGKLGDGLLVLVCHRDAIAASPCPARGRRSEARFSTGGS